MPNLGWQELLLIMIFALVVFGPKRLPDIGRQVGRAIREVRKVSGQFQEEIKTGLALDDESFPYMKAPQPPEPTAESRPAGGAGPDTVRYGEVRSPTASAEAEEPPAPQS